ncbi:MAG: HD domain-containing protein [Bacteroidales bacterium]
MTKNKIIVVLYKNLLSMALNPNKIEETCTAFSRILSSGISARLVDAIAYIFETETNENELQKKIDFSKEIAAICVKEIDLDETSAIAALIYYSKPKESLEQQVIIEKFGAQVAGAINGLVKIPDIRLEKLSIQAENFIKLLLTISTDIRSVLIKLSEMLFLLRSLKDSEDELRFNTAQVIFSLYAPIAHRLGLYAIKTEMEDISLKYLNPDIYKQIAKKLEESKESRNKYIEEFISPLKKELQRNHIKCEIKGRPKSIFSIWNKMKTQHVEFDEVYDKFAIRVIIDTEPDNEKSECWRAYSIITDLYKPNPLRLRDWISSPKTTGYESLHTTVIGPQEKWIEVQIRTVRMDEIAEKGHAAHWKYKEKKEGSGSDWLKQMREALEKPNPETDEEHDRNKAMLYTDEIFIFTPEGDLRKLRAGYTVLDFAFSIHSGLGETCTGAIVNDRIVSYKHVLKNGDKVKILTSKNQRPRYEWLEIAKSQRARAKIKRALKSIDYKDSDQGKDMVKYKLNQLKIDYSESIIVRLVELFGFKSSVDFYQAVGSGKLEIQRIKKALAELENQVEKQKETREEISTEVTEFQNKTEIKDFLVIENNLQTIDYQMAKCCNPVPGDEIFGFISVSKGTRIHKKSCTNASDLLTRYPYRIIAARWNTENEMTRFMAQIRIVGEDRLGISNSITEIISKEFKLNLRALNIHVRKDNKFEGIIVTTVNNKQQLDELMNRLRKIEDIHSVNRVSK